MDGNHFRCPKGIHVTNLKETLAVKASITGKSILRGEVFIASTAIGNST